jgi:alpha-N-arabinofuranosidase
MATAEWADERLTATEGLIDAMRLCGHIKHPVYLAVDEWNVWYRVRNEGKLEEVYNLEDALVNALQLNTFIRHARTVKMANLAQIVNVIAPIVTRPDGLLLQSIFFPQEIYSQFAGDTALDVYWAGDTFQAGDQPGLRVLDVSATLDRASGQVAVFVVNRSESQEAETRITLQTGAFGGPGMAYTVAGNDPKAFNTFENPDVVRTESKALALQGSDLHYAFPPCSVTALVFPCK